MLTFRRIATRLLLVSLACSNAAVLFAQDVLPSAKILVISREYTKPGKDGPAHQAVEGAYPRALAAGKIPNHYYAAVSLSGSPRVFFFHGYDSYAEWLEASRGAITDPTVASTLARITAADGDLLSSKDYSVWAKRDDLSLNPGFRVGARVEVIIQYVCVPGMPRNLKTWSSCTQTAIRVCPGCTGAPMKRRTVLPATRSWSSSRISPRPSLTPRRTTTIKSSRRLWGKKG